ncbi:hypothetical protein E2C01_102388 [Portunus trituberculatus]|uniref:Uncharacterized protein n=1 Tax=Portunus trituberculatus TaxID=210409 RepID=A0A5B7KCG6_PORTR|nr:hypothetical protein [Portunus trituberculatus]
MVPHKSGPTSECRSRREELPVTLSQSPRPGSLPLHRLSQNQLLCQ